jgi:hypothetical protein
MSLEVTYVKVAERRRLEQAGASQGGEGRGLQCKMVSPVNFEATKRTTSSSATGGMTSLHWPICKRRRG